MDKMKYRVWLIGRSMSASYNGYVDVWAEGEDDANYKAKRKLTGPGGSFRDWSPSMFKTEKIERIFN